MVEAYRINRIQRKDHKIGAYEINKILLFCFDDQIYIQSNGYDGLILGYDNWLQKTSLFWKLFRKAFLSNYKNIFLILSKIRAAFLSSYKHIVLIVSQIRIGFFLLFSFIICKLVDSEYSTGDYKYSKFSIGGIMKNPEMLKFVLDHLETKKMCNKAILEDGWTLKSAPNWYKT